jgi:hypothetical protein
LVPPPGVWVGLGRLPPKKLLKKPELSLAICSALMRQCVRPATLPRHCTVCDGGMLSGPTIGAGACMGGGGTGCPGRRGPPAGAGLGCCRASSRSACCTLVIVIRSFTIAIACAPPNPARGKHFVRGRAHLSLSLCVGMCACVLLRLAARRTFWPFIKSGCAVLM